MVIKGKEVIKFLNEEFSLLNSILCGIKVFEEDYIVGVSIEFKTDKNNVILNFKNVKKTYFYYDENYIFYNVEDYKLLLINDREYYLSIDPDLTTEGISDSDGDVVWSYDLEMILN